MKTFSRISFIFLLGMFSAACTTFSSVDEERIKVQSLLKELGSVKNIQEESRILTELWGFTGEKSKIQLTLSAIDAEGNSVINDLSGAISPVEVSLGIQGETWFENIEFTALDKDNLYILLNE